MVKERVFCLSFPELQVSVVTGKIRRSQIYRPLFLFLFGDDVFHCLTKIVCRSQRLMTIVIICKHLIFLVLSSLQKMHVKSLCSLWKIFSMNVNIPD